MKAVEIINLLNQWANPKLIDTWDNTGFQIGDPEKEIKKIIISLDLDSLVLNKAIEENIDMIITHHPIIFKPLKALTKLNYKEKLIYEIVKSDIVVYNAHSNLDLAEDGVNDILAKTLGIKNFQPLNSIYEEALYKLVVFVPNSHADIIRKILGDEGAGRIGNYSHCTYNIEGIGTFMPQKGTNPFIGEINKLEEAEETRIETIVKEENLKNVINKMIKSHPYEEVAYDLYPLAMKNRSFGYGRVGEVEKIHLEEYLNKVKKSLDTKHLIVYGNIDRIINRVAVCGGSGASFIYNAYKKGAQIYITGDVKYHDAQYANELGLTIVDGGHYNTEKVILPVIKEYLEKRIKDTIEIQLHNESSPPYVVY